MTSLTGRQHVGDAEWRASNRQEQTVLLDFSSAVDDVAHATQGTAWPSDPSDPRPLPSPWAKVSDEALAFGYGSVCLADDIRVSDVAL